MASIIDFLDDTDEVQNDKTPELICYLPSLDQRPVGLTLPVKSCQNKAAKIEFFGQIYSCNYFKCRNVPSPYNQNAKICAQIAYLRALLVQEGLIDIEATAQQKHADYILYREFPYSIACNKLAGEKEINDCAATLKDSRPNVTAQNLTNEEVDGYINLNNKAKIKNEQLDSEKINLWLKQLPDLICLAAWIFRTKGNNYKPEFEETIGRVWKETSHSHGTETVDIPWKYLFCDVFKAIFPIDLEAAYLDYVKRGLASENMIIKYESFPAGAAAYQALIKAYSELIPVYPELKIKFQNNEQLLNQIKEANMDPVKRMSLSINARFYGLKRLELDDSKLAPMAAYLFAMLKEYQPGNSLLKSPAFKRLAGNAPVTGSVMGKIFKNYFKKE